MRRRSSRETASHRVRVGNFGNKVNLATLEQIATERTVQGNPRRSYRVFPSSSKSIHAMTLHNVVLSAVCKDSPRASHTAQPRSACGGTAAHLPAYTSTRYIGVLDYLARCAASPVASCPGDGSYKSTRLPDVYTPTQNHLF